MKRVIALVRVSSEAQAAPEREGIPAQERVCKQVARSNNLQIVDWVTLKGVSGAAVLQDPRFQSLLHQLQTPRIEGIVVSDFDRLFRRGRFSDYAILDAFADTESILYSSDGTYNPSEDAGGLLGVLRGELAGMERRKIAERTRRGREEKRRRSGCRPEGPVGLPRGVTFHQQSGEWRYVWPEAGKARNCFELFLSGTENLAEIGRQVGIGGGNPSWAVRSVLRQPLYAGIYRVSRRWTNGKSTPRSPDETYEHKVFDEPLVSADDFERVQKRLEGLSKKRPPVRKPEDRPGEYPGFLQCGECGHSMVVVIDARGYAGYRCGQIRTGVRCKTGQISIRLGDPQIDATMERMLGSEETLRRLIDASYEEAERRAELDPRSIDRKITELENRRERCMDAYESSEYELPQLSKRLAAIKGEMARLREFQEHAEEPIEMDSEVISKVVDVFGSWASLSRSEKRKLLRAYRIRIHVTRSERRKIHVSRVDVGLLGYVGLYKKMKRYGIT